MKGKLYYTGIIEEKGRKNPGHEEGKKLLELGLLREYGVLLKEETLSYGPQGKPYLVRHPEIYYNISHSGRFAACIFAEKEVGMDIQLQKEVNYRRMLKRMVPEEMVPSILEAEDMKKAFFTQWVLREAYIKWTGEGLKRDLRTIPFEDGSYTLFELEEDVRGAVWASEPVDLVLEYVSPAELEEAEAKE